jgi:transcriptional regulator with XRE-family HTH domain
MEQVAVALANNLKALRELRGLTQARLAGLSGVPRATLASLESGGANPTLAVLVKVAAALQVSVEELISPPRASARLIRADELPVRRRGGVSVRALVPDVIPGLQVERLELAPDGRMTGTPHTPGTREYLCCEAGEVVLVCGGEQHRLGPGDVVVFRGDQRHGYHNPGEGVAVAYSLVLPGAMRA